jgi:hypothetical protein
MRGSVMHKTNKHKNWDLFDSSWKGSKTKQMPKELVVYIVQKQRKKFLECVKFSKTFIYLSQQIAINVLCSVFHPIQLITTWI